jgi:hypothetical protein
MSTIATRPDLVAKLIVHRQRFEAIASLSAKTEAHALNIARRYTTCAGIDDITAALQTIERTKLKTYASVKSAGIDGEPYAGILDLLHSAKISIAELDAWVIAIKRTTFASGNKFQPLPTHDEAWQTFSRVFNELHTAKLTARTLLSTIPPKLSDEDIRTAARFYWELMALPLRQQAWLLIPEDEQLAIRIRHPNNPDGAMQSTANYYNKPKTTTS